MTKCYVIIAGHGEYSGRCEWPVRVYVDKEKAQAEMAKLETIAGQISRLWNDYWKASSGNENRDTDYQKIVDQSRANYASLGYQAVKDDYYDPEDWKLEEAEFVG